MKTIINKFFILIAYLLGIAGVFAAPNPPPPNGRNQGPPPPPPGRCPPHCPHRCSLQQPSCQQML